LPLNLSGPITNNNPPKRQRRTANEVHTPEHIAERKATHGEVDKQEIAWLEQKASEMPGYGAFISSRGRTLQNVEVIASWQFAVTFTAQYVGKPSEVIVSSALHIITVTQPCLSQIGTQWLCP
jgi:hypothetical protein